MPADGVKDALCSFAIAVVVVLVANVLMQLMGWG